MHKPTVLVTRPSHQNKRLSDLLTAEGCNVLLFPTIAIEPSTPTPFLQNLADNINNFDIALFVSRNAVDHTFCYLSPMDLPKTLQIGVIGKGSWSAMQQKGINTQIIPAQNYNSEGLLASAELEQVAGKKIIVFRGQEGRNLLGDTLQQRGAAVRFCEVYRRVLPQYAKDYFSLLIKPDAPDLVVFTSAEGLLNCFKVLTDTQAEGLRQTPWLLISERMRETALNLGHNAEIIIATYASDEGILQAIQEWRQAKA